MYLNRRGIAAARLELRLATRLAESQAFERIERRSQVRAEQLLHADPLQRDELVAQAIPQEVGSLVRA